MPELVINNTVYIIEKCEYCDRFYLKEKLFRWYKYKWFKLIVCYDYICRSCINETHINPDMVPIDNRKLVQEKPLKEDEKAFNPDI
jgi:hypothetical protein